MIAWEAVRLLRALNLRPRRTVRVVLWTNEENGLAGAKAYEKAHARELGTHVMAFEADEGCFNPIAFGFDGSDAALMELQKFLPHLRALGVREIARGGLEADIAGLAETGIPSVGLRVDGGKYFWYHHTQADTIDKIDPAALNRCIAATAILGYLVAEGAERLPR